MLGSLSRSIRRDWASYCIILLGTAIQIALITRPLDFLVTNLLPDDAFYYFEIARNLAAGHGSTFDGIHSTNGYHPLWLLVLVPIFSLLSVGGTTDLAPLYTALALSVVLNALTALIVLRLVSSLTQNQWMRAFAVMVWCLNPFVIFESLNGLETSLALFLTSCFFLAALAAERRDGYLAYASAGAIAGFMVLARIDLVFYAAAFVAWILLRYGIKTGFRRALAAGVPLVILVAPWFIYNLAGYGMLLTSASGANPLVNHTLTVLDNGSSLFASIKAVLYMLVTFGQDVVMRTGASWLPFIFIGAAVAWTADRTIPLALSRKEFPLLFALFLGFAALFLVNAGIRFTGRSWYFISANLFVVIAAAYLAQILVQRHRHVLPLLSVLTVSVVISFSISWYSVLHDSMLAQRGMLDAAAWMNEHLPEGTKVGVFNAGIEGYFSSATIVNLDGLVNNSAYEALRERRIWDYMQEEEIEYLADFDIYLDYRYASFFGRDDIRSALEEVVRIPVHKASHDMEGLSLYKVR